VARGVLFLSCSSLRASACTSRNIVNMISCRAFDTFHKNYINDALWDRDERVTFWGQKVKGQGHGGIQYAGNSTLALTTPLSGGIPYSMTWRRVIFI